MVHQPLFPSFSVGFGASIVAHVGLMVAVARGSAATRPLASADRAESPIEIEMVDPLETQAAEPPAVEPSRPVLRSSRFQRHHHPYPVAPGHDAVPHDERLQHARTAAAVVAEAAGVVAADAPASPEAPPPVPHFVLAVGGPRASARATSPSVTSVPGGGAAGDTHGGGDGEGGDAVLAESLVTERARLQSSVAAVYPAAARQSEIEADVPVEIVVDSAGRVTAAQVLRHAGYGLDDAALGAISHYRFSPARRDGRPVRVRMRWVVQFRLR